MKSLNCILLFGIVLTLTSCSNIQPRKAASAFSGTEIFPYTKDNYYYGLADKTGNVLVEPAFNYYDNYDPKSKIYKFNKLDNCYLANNLGATVGPFEDCRKSANTHLMIKKNEKWALFEYAEDIILGKQLTGYDFDIIMPFDNGVAYFKQGQSSGLINTQGKIILQTSKQINFSTNSNDGDGFSAEGLISYFDQATGNRYGFINTNDEIVIEPYFRNIKAFRDGLAVVAMPTTKYGYIDINSTKNKNPKKIQFAIPAKYVFARSFSEGLAPVSDGNCYFYINKKGVKQFGNDSCFSDAQSFNKQIAIVNINNKFGLIANNGNFIVNTDYNELNKISDSLFYGAHADGTFHLLNTNGNVEFKSNFPFDVFEPYAIEKNGKDINVVNTFSPDSKFTISNCDKFKVYGYVISCQDESSSRYYDIETKSEITFQ